MTTTYETNPLISTQSVQFLQYRIREEEMSARLYLAMSMWLENQGYVNAPKLWKKYSDEEITHSKWARDYLLSLGVTPIVPTLTEVVSDFQGLPDIIKRSYEHEIVITNQMKQFARHCLEEGDHMLYTLAMKYLAEQVEEHDKTIKWMDALKTFGTDLIALRLLDNDMKNSL